MRRRQAVAFSLAAVASVAILTLADDRPEQTAEPVWQVWQSEDLVARRAASGKAYLRFLDVPALSAGIYRLAAEAVDRQSPHDQDEIYYVLSGRAGFRSEGGEERVKAGDVIYVKAGAEHQFFDVEEELELLVFFSKAPG